MKCFINRATLITAEGLFLDCLSVIPLLVPNLEKTYSNKQNRNFEVVVLVMPTTAICVELKIKLKSPLTTKDTYFQILLQGKRGEDAGILQELPAVPTAN